MKSFNSYLFEKKKMEDKGKYDSLIKQLESINKGNKDVKSVIAMLKQGRDLSESYEDIILKEEVAEFIKAIEEV